MTSSKWIQIKFLVLMVGIVGSEFCSAFPSAQETIQRLKGMSYGGLVNQGYRSFLLEKGFSPAAIKGRIKEVQDQIERIVDQILAGDRGELKAELGVLNFIDPTLGEAALDIVAPLVKSGYFPRTAQVSRPVAQTAYQDSPSGGDLPTPIPQVQSLLRRLEEGPVAQADIIKEILIPGTSLKPSPVSGPLASLPQPSSLSGPSSQIAQSYPEVETGGTEPMQMELEEVEVESSPPQNVDELIVAQNQTQENIARLEKSINASLEHLEGLYEEIAAAPTADKPAIVEIGIAIDDSIKRDEEKLDEEKSKQKKLEEQIARIRRKQWVARREKRGRTFITSGTFERPGAAVPFDPFSGSTSRLPYKKTGCSSCQRVYKRTRTRK